MVFHFRNALVDQKFRQIKGRRYRLMVNLAAGIAPNLEP